jgi:Tol biopolymer transport system component
MRADGMGEPQLIYRTEVAVDRFALSPDGRTLIVAPHGPDVWMLPLDTSDPDRPKPGKPEPFLHRTRPGFTTAFSPDGRWIAWSSHEPHETGIYVRPTGKSSGGIQISFGQDDFFPVWSRTTRQILYQDNDGHIQVIDYVTHGESFSPAKPRLWLEKPVAAANRRRFFDLSRDGKHILTFAHPVSERNIHITFMFNFFDEVRRRLDR